jgi:hypothetical protein
VLLVEEESLLGATNLNAEEVVEWAKIFHGKHRA